MMKKIKVMLALHLLVFLYSLEAIVSKIASGEAFLSLRFLLLYGLVVLLMGIYAIGWQQVIRRMPLTVAFANKAVTVVWGFIYGILFFQETATPLRIAGLVLVVAGVVLFAFSDESEEKS
jgi:drug/metabolite transporter (DMT)-like permease